MVKYVKGRTVHGSDHEGDLGAESDCEDDSPEVEHELLGEEKTRAVITTGSFSAYVHFPSGLRFERNDGSPAGNHFTSTFVRIRSCSLPSNHKASISVWVTFSKRRSWQHLLLARRRVYSPWLIW